MGRSGQSIGHVRNRLGWRQHLSRLRGSAIRFDLREYDAPLEQINRLEHTVGGLSDAALEGRARELRAQARAGIPLADIRSEVFALVRDASRRALRLRPFDVQVVAALALDRRAVVEMQTGEGKTLTAVMPVALNALAGGGVHVLTFNDYLAARDAAWMGPVYRTLGLSVDHVEQGMSPARRRAAYRADITYVTAKEAGFDYLRDLLAMDTRELVHRDFRFALVDEADSLLVDEARIPLVIAGSVDGGGSASPPMAGLIASLTRGVHFATDEYGRDVELTDRGIEHIERTLGRGSLHMPENLRLLTEINCALHAQVLLQRDVDYIVRNGRIEIVDEFTGRVVNDRVWPDGLQAALEEKEGLTRRGDGQILGSITLQRFLGRYSHLCGMTGTAQDAAFEIRQFYGVEVVVIPTHRPMVRVDRPDLVFTHREAKERAVIETIRRAHASRRPVLVGTATVEESERLAGRLRAAGVSCEVLNAKNDAEEARIIARAGAPGAVTISTNMAGRGTDIRLDDHGDRDQVAALGGLYVIGTNQHESRRIDLQLRGRAGRQGDPGESRFFLSLEDDLLVRFGLRRLIPAHVVPAATHEPIDHPIVRREIARAQRIVDGQNVEIRRTLSRYASIVEEQHEIVMTWRRALLAGEVAPEIWQRAIVRRAALVAGAGEEAVLEAERAVTLFQIDRAWREHLDFCATLREGIHLTRLGGQDPLQRFATEAMRAFAGLEKAIGQAVLAAIEDVRLTAHGVDLTAVGITRPSATWTYLVNDDPFRNQIGALLTGPGGITVAIYSAFVLMPLLMLWGLVDRFAKKRRFRGRSETFGGMR
jgi:preprotein translocase subunit SecA